MKKLSKAQDALGLPGTLVWQEFAPGTGDSWEIRKEDPADNRMCYVLYFNGQVHSRYSRPESVYRVLRSHCPYVQDVKGDMGL